MDGAQIDSPRAGFGLGKVKLMGLVVVLAVLVGELELGVSFLSQIPFPVVEFIEIVYAMGAGVVTTLVDGNLFSLFPGEEGVLAVGAVVFGLSWAETFFLLEEMSANLAKELGSFFAVIVVEIGMRGLAGGAAGGLRDARGAGPVLYGR